MNERMNNTVLNSRNLFYFREVPWHSCTNNQMRPSARCDSPRHRAHCYRLPMCHFVSSSTEEVFGWCLGRLRTLSRNVSEGLLMSRGLQLAPKCFGRLARGRPGDRFAWKRSGIMALSFCILVVVLIVQGAIAQTECESRYEYFCHESKDCRRLSPPCAGQRPGKYPTL